MSTLRDITNLSTASKRKLPSATNTAKGSEHMRIGERFVQLCNSLEDASSTYVRHVPKHQPQSDYPLPVKGEAYLVTHLKHCLRSWVTRSEATRSGAVHHLMKIQGKDGRRNLPKALQLKLKDTYSSEKVEAKWIACYLAGIRPDETVEGWEYFECSHRCIEYDLRGQGLTCITAECLVWESKSVNQSRGQDFCMRVCKHAECGKRVCECQAVHVPACK